MSNVPGAAQDPDPGPISTSLPCRNRPTEEQGWFLSPSIPVWHWAFYSGTRLIHQARKHPALIDAAGMAGADCRGL